MSSFLPKLAAVNSQQKQFYSYHIMWQYIKVYLNTGNLFHDHHLYNLSIAFKIGKVNDFVMQQVVLKQQIVKLFFQCVITCSEEALF